MSYSYSSAGAYLTSPLTLLSTELDALPIGGTAVSTGSFNNPVGFLYGDLRLTLGQAASGYLEVWFLRSLDGINFEDAPPGRRSDVSVAIGPTGAPAGVPQFFLPPGSYKVAVRNKTNAALATSGSTLAVAEYTELAPDPSPGTTESVDGTVLSSTSGAIVDALGAAWTLVVGGTTGLSLARSNVALAVSVAFAVYSGRVVSYKNRAGNWFRWTGSAFVAASEPRESAEGTILSSTTGSLMDSQSIRWTLVNAASGLVALHNGYVHGLNITRLEYLSHKVHRLEAGSYYGWEDTTSSWVDEGNPSNPTPDPPIVSVIGSPTQTTIQISFVLASSGPAIDAGGVTLVSAQHGTGAWVDGPTAPIATPGHGSISLNGHTWKIGTDQKIYVDDVIDDVTRLVTMVTTVGDGKLWQVNTGLDWYWKSLPTDTWAGPITTPPFASPGMTITGLAPDTLYDIAGYASSTVGDGDIGSPISARTQAQPADVPYAPTVSILSTTSNTIAVGIAKAVAGPALDAGAFYVRYKPASEAGWLDGPSSAYCTPGIGTVADANGLIWSITSPGGETTQPLFADEFNGRPMTTTLHYAPNHNVVAGYFVPGDSGFNIADIAYGSGGVSTLNALPSNVKGLVYTGYSAGGADATFQARVDPFIGNSKLYGFYLADEPDITNSWGTYYSVANLKAQADYIHANFPGAITFIILANQGSPTSPDYSTSGGYTPANTDIDLFGIDPYPVRSDVTNGFNLNIIDSAVTSAVASGVPLAKLVPVFQAFGGGSYAPPFNLPTTTQATQLLARWETLLPSPVFDMAYSWGAQSGDTALENDAALAAVFAAHNAASPSAWMTHADWVSGDKWAWGSGLEPHGLRDGTAPTYWCNPAYTPACSATASLASGILSLGLIVTPGGQGITTPATGVIMNNRNTPGGLLRLYGYFEFRAAVPAVPGFLLHWDMEDYPAYPSWTVEIDIDIWTDSNGQHVMFKEAVGGAIIYQTTTVNISAFHTYGLNWQADYITAYIDGTQVGRINNPGGDYQSKPGFCYFLTSDATYLYGVTTSVSLAALPVYAQIEYFRIYPDLPTTTQTGNQLRRSDTGIDGITRDVVFCEVVDGVCWQLNGSGDWWYSTGDPGAWGGPQTSDPLTSSGLTISGLDASTDYDVDAYVTNVAGSGALSTTVPAKTSGGASTGKFKVSGGQIIDPDGNTFKAMGLNAPDWGSGMPLFHAITNAANATPLVTTFPGINFVRVPVFERMMGLTPQDFKPYVDGLTSRRIVVEFEPHDYPPEYGPGVYSGNDLTVVTGWIGRMADYYKDNTYVWFGTQNEPANGNSNLPGMLSGIYNAVRNAGNTNPVMICVWGNYEYGMSGVSTTHFNTWSNAIWDMHYYNWVTGYSADSATLARSIANNVMQLQTYRSADGIVPVIIGEFGDSTGSQSVDAGGYQLLTEVYKNSSGFAQWYWNWDYGTPDTGDRLLLSPFDGSNLTTGGQMLKTAILAGRPVAQKPGVPTAFTAISATQSSITVSFAPPTSGGTIDAGGYRLQYQTGAGGWNTGPFVPVVTSGHGSFYDPSNHKWAIGTDAKIYVDDVVDDPTANVVWMALIGGTIWQINSAGNWYWATVKGGWDGPTTTSPLSSPGVTYTGLTNTTTYQLRACATNTVGDGNYCSPISKATLSPSQAGDFVVQGAQVLRPDGSEFPIQGTALYSANSTDWAFTSWNDSHTVDTLHQGYQYLLTAFPKMNYLRIPIWRGFADKYPSDFFDDVINYMTARSVVVAFDSHDYGVGYPVVGDWLNVISGQYAFLADRYASNPYVWFESMNEPGWGNGPGDMDTMVPTLHSVIRDKGNKQPFVITSMGGNPQAFQMYNDVSVYRKLDNIIFAPHWYTESSSGLSYGAYPDKSYDSHYNAQQDIFNQLKEWFGSSCAIIFGETGANCCSPPEDSSWPNMVSAMMEHHRLRHFAGYVCWLFGPPFYDIDRINVEGNPGALSSVGQGYGNGML